MLAGCLLLWDVMWGRCTPAHREAWLVQVALHPSMTVVCVYTTQNLSYSGDSCVDSRDRMGVRTENSHTCNHSIHIHIRSSHVFRYRRMNQLLNIHYPLSPYPSMGGGYQVIHLKRAFKTLAIFTTIRKGCSEGCLADADLPAQTVFAEPILHPPINGLVEIG